MTDDDTGKIIDMLMANNRHWRDMALEWQDWAEDLLIAHDRAPAEGMWEDYQARALISEMCEKEGE